LAEELWERLGHADGLAAARWPEADAAAAAEDRVEIPVQVNGKVRARVEMPAGSADDAIREAALALPGLQAHLANMEVVRVVVANGRLVNVVVKPVKSKSSTEG